MGIQQIGPYEAYLMLILSWVYKSLLKKEVWSCLAAVLGNESYVTQIEMTELMLFLLQVAAKLQQNPSLAAVKQISSFGSRVYH